MTVMQFSLTKSFEILEHTPDVLISLLGNASAGWISSNEGGDSWSPYEIVGHLIHCEKTDWFPRAKIILSGDSEQVWEPFDRFAHLSDTERSLQELLSEFKSFRRKNIGELQNIQIDSEDLERQGTHPAFGPVTLSQLLSAWVVHDLNHIAQIARVMAYQYKAEVGPWIDYLSILTRK